MKMIPEPEPGDRIVYRLEYGTVHENEGQIYDGVAWEVAVDWDNGDKNVAYANWDEELKLWVVS